MAKKRKSYYVKVDKDLAHQHRSEAAKQRWEREGNAPTTCIRIDKATAAALSAWCKESGEVCTKTLTNIVRGWLARH